MKKFKISLLLFSCILFFSIQAQAQNSSKANQATGKVTVDLKQKAPQKVAPALNSVKTANKQVSYSPSTITPALPQISVEETAYRNNLKQSNPKGYQTYLSQLNDIRYLEAQLNEASVFDKALIQNKINMIQTQINLNK